MSRTLSIILGLVVIGFSFYIGFRGNEKTIKNIEKQYSSQSKNSLAGSKSDYLVSFANSPIYWQEWTEDAFLTALHQKKLVFIHLGRKSCSPCDQMEAVFSDAEIVKLLNDHFVSIRIDADQNRQVALAYEEVVMLVSQTNSYPLNVFLTADMKPFFGVSLSSVEEFKILLRRIANLWEADPSQIIESTEKLKKVLKGR